jgi:hypothetical protein
MPCIHQSSDSQSLSSIHQLSTVSQCPVFIISLVFIYAHPNSQRLVFIYAHPSKTLNSQSLVFIIVCSQTCSPFKVNILVFETLYRYTSLCSFLPLAKAKKGRKLYRTRPCAPSCPWRNNKKEKKCTVHVLVDLLALGDGSNDADILDTTIGARTHEHLVNLHLIKLLVRLKAHVLEGALHGLAAKLVVLLGRIRDIPSDGGHILQPRAPAHRQRYILVYIRLSSLVYVLLYILYYCSKKNSTLLPDYHFTTH